MKLLNVIPNIFVALDAIGMPCGFTFADPTLPDAPRFRVVGGVLTKDIKSVERAPDDMRETKVVVGSRISLMKPTPVEPTEYHCARIRSGEMIAADVETAEACGISKKSFRSPVEILNETRNARIAEWNAEHGGENPVCDGLEILPSDKGGVLIQWSEAAKAKAEGRKLPKKRPVAEPAPTLAPAPAKLVATPPALAPEANEPPADSSPASSP